MAVEGLVKVTINGQECEVQPNLNVLEAAKTIGIEIAHYCYHKYLSAPAVCRMCLVEIEGVPKLQPACHTPIREGMVVSSDSERVREATRNVLEFTLLNHPLDCPVCDQAGECGLHDYYVSHGLYNSKMTLPKVHKKKVQTIGPTLILDAERCILCSRCVRFSEEITKTNDMAIVNRGDHAEITAVKEVTNDYSTNLADICPVGALTQRDFRFKTRVWNLQSTDSVCPGCARGCNVTLDHFRGNVQRIRPRENDKVNDIWMCDEGRLLYKDLDAPNRIQSPMVRRNNNLEVTSWDEAIAVAIELLKEADGSVVGQMSAYSSNEDAFALASLLETLKAPKAAAPLEGESGWEDDELLRRKDRTPNQKGTALMAGEGHLGDLIKDAKVAVVVNEDIISKVSEGASYLGTIYLGTHAHATAQSAAVILPIAAWAESNGSFTNFEGRVQSFSRAVPPPNGVMPGWQILGQLAAGFDGKNYENIEDIFAALAQKITPFGSMTYASLGSEGLILEEESK